VRFCDAEEGWGDAAGAEVSRGKHCWAGDAVSCSFGRGFAMAEGGRGGFRCPRFAPEIEDIWLVAIEEEEEAERDAVTLSLPIPRL
jgi:hypothetical protein